MHLWQDIIKALSPKTQKAITPCHPKVTIKRDLRNYYLHDAYPHIYLTKREAESVFWLMHGFTIIETAYKMYLSPRTIEFYVKNMKTKLNCDSKKMLLEKIGETRLIDQLRAEGMCVQIH